jgi:putative ABC transport system permease protein
MILRIAWRNIVSAGLRTWLNTLILSLTLFSIIAIQGMNNGLLKQISEDRIEQELGQGQWWNRHYDPFDPLSLMEAHAPIPGELQPAINRREAIPILMVAGTAYPQGRVFPAVLKGIPPEQNVLDLPFEYLSNDVPPGTLPAMIGGQMARKTRLQENDTITVRWRNSRGVYNAVDLTIVRVFSAKVPAMDQGQIWLRLADIQQMNLSPNHATLIITTDPIDVDAADPDWIGRTLDDLLADTYQLVSNKTVGAGILYLILVFLAMIAVFDTQALSIFRRRKEIGTLMALGMTHRAITGTFTLEGVLYGLLAAVVTAVYGTPLLWWFQTHGYHVPVAVEDYGMAISDHLYPHFSPGLIVGTLVTVMVLLTIVSYLPARRIARQQPYDALRGKWA